MDGFYPRKTAARAIVPADPGALDVAIVQAIERGETKAQAIGPVLAGSDDVPGFEAAWDRVQVAQDAAAAVNPLDFDDEANYATAVGRTSPVCDGTKWATGLLAKYDVTKWSALKAKLSPDVA